MGGIGVETSNNVDFVSVQFACAESSARLSDAAPLLFFGSHVAEAAKAGAIGAATTKVAYNLKGGPVDLQSSNLCKPPDNPGSRSYFIPAVTELPNNLKISGTDTVEPGTDS